MPAYVDSSQSTIKAATEGEGVSAQASAGVELPQVCGTSVNYHGPAGRLSVLSHSSGTSSSHSQADVEVASNAYQ